MATAALSLNPLFRNSVGFDRFNDLFETLHNDKQSSGYPPYDIIKASDNAYQIVMAVAGFSEQQINIVLENGRLNIKGEQANTSENSEPLEYLHRGIAKRAFEQSFRLADHMKVKQARLENGLLVVELEREIPEEKKPQTIAISKSS